ncbi:MAG: Abi family protein [Erysipelotrichales bacterium]|nr:Abi family protein [Erysipelotrichales bacterium]
MSKTKPKTINSLMKYLKNKKGITIYGSIQKRQLMNMGYYHGYKGYRFFYNASNPIAYSNFKELDAIYSFDSNLKALFYPYIMFIETALKNRVLIVLLEKTGAENFNDIYALLLTDYKSYTYIGKTFPSKTTEDKAKKKYSYALKRRLELRDKIYNLQTKAYVNGNRIAKHYYDSQINIPIWGIFELLTLGEFGHLISCIEINTRLDISKKLKIRRSDDTDGKILELIVYAIRDLRNAIAHNSVVYDTRFKSRDISKQLINNIKNETSISDVNFSSIIDYLILVIYVLKLLGKSKTELKQLISSFEKLVLTLKSKIPSYIFNQVIQINYSTKINKLKKYVKE